MTELEKLNINKKFSKQSNGVRTPINHLLLMGPYWEIAGLVGIGTLALEQGASVALSGDGSTVAIGTAYTISEVAEGVYIFVNRNDSWIQQAILPGVGYSVALSYDGNYLVMGSPSVDDLNGATFVFHRENNVWTQMAKLVGMGTPQYPNIGFGLQGYSVAISRNAKTIAIGGIFDNVLTGAVWIFSRIGDIWSQDAKIVGSNEGAPSYQGSSVALSADGMTLAEGGVEFIFPDLKGAVWVFQKNTNDGRWIQDGAKLVNPEANIFAQGTSVALDYCGELLAAGAPGAGDGFVLIYVRCNDKWSRFGNPIKGGIESGFGASVSLSNSGKLLAVGAPMDNNNFGATYVYKQNECDYIQIQKVIGSAAGNPFQGTDVSISANGKTLAIGGKGDINSGGEGSTQGKTWIFEIDTSEC
ncbi:MAG: hypothetical protein Harvfovirus20_16 [Harvfovirus sp.]|uniref:Uncharacterized protein n=1 Tax=Harvfovirus sp. TaxID=2487768 RepID=A0A3G5A1V1_9VIRU|nr:MAG: hypothetical protein Harvfovirus20_16 [Harvfovirus sp.]